MLAVTDDETVNLEIALVAKDANPSVRAVARVLITTSQAGWSGGCSWVPRAAYPCWRRRAARSGNSRSPVRAGSSPGVALPARTGSGDILITRSRETNGSRLLRPGLGWPGCYV